MKLSQSGCFFSPGTESLLPYEQAVLWNELQELCGRKGGNEEKYSLFQAIDLKRQKVLISCSFDGVFVDSSASGSPSPSVAYESGIDHSLDLFLLIISTALPN